ncbi:MAG: hypothetical protein QUV02_05610 [Maricaulis sp.]|jgi:hypothetical protein|uniref:hypothetical protein n=1 Tax=Maricaulis sp. TaxID=1486257 RepID=UPI0026343033|nr:hypothetical protein [Maricaulis sp.]MDM7983906.1 hypothetical protein [Maricaulis sp.]
MSTFIAELIEWLAVFSMSLMGIEYSRVIDCADTGAEASAISYVEYVDYTPAQPVAFRFEGCDTQGSSEIRFQTINA